MPMFLLSKLSLAVCWGLALVRFLQTDDVISRDFCGVLLAALFIALGAVLIAVSMVTLRSSLCPGLPERKTELITRGVYQRSRNPLYLGVFIVSAAAAAYAQSLAAYLLLAVGLVLHHRIVLSEEKFLEERFGEAWRLYSRRVRRYL